MLNSFDLFNLLFTISQLQLRSLFPEMLMQRLNIDVLCLKHKPLYRIAIAANKIYYIYICKSFPLWSIFALISF